MYELGRLHLTPSSLIMKLPERAWSGVPLADPSKGCEGGWEESTSAGVSASLLLHGRAPSVTPLSMLLCTYAAHAKQGTGIYCLLPTRCLTRGPRDPAVQWPRKEKTNKIPEAMM